MTEMTAEETEALYRRFIETVWNERNLDAIEEFVADDCVMRDAASPEPMHGPEGVREFVEMYHAAFPDAHVEVEEVLATDDRVAARFTATGTHEGALWGIEPTGRSVTVSGLELDRFEDGKFVESWQVYDALGMFQQLGVVPETEEFAERAAGGKP